MVRFYGVVGYGDTVEKRPGVWEDVIVARKYYGDVLRNTRVAQQADKINDDITVSNSISVVADPYAYQNFFNIRYIEWSGQAWVVTQVQMERPRLILTLGGKYNGPRSTS